MASNSLGVRDSDPDKDVGHFHLTVVSRMALWPKQNSIELIQENAAAGVRTRAYCRRLEYVAFSLRAAPWSPWRDVFAQFHGCAVRQPVTRQGTATANINKRSTPVCLGRISVTSRELNHVPLA